MVKITYDLNNSEHCELINDYYFLKYFLKCLVNDWRSKFIEVFMKAFENHCVETDLYNLNQMIMKHINKYELNFSLEILFKNQILNRERNKDDEEYITDLLWNHKSILDDYKQILIFEFS